jgi:hypothetical protein
MALGNSAGEMLAECRAHQDPTVKRVAESCAEFRNHCPARMPRSYGTIFAARALAIRWG